MHRKLFQNLDQEKQAQLMALTNAGDGDPFKTTVLSLLLDIHSDVKMIDDRLSALEVDLPEAHRKFLSQMVTDSNEKNAVWLEVKKKLASGGAWAVIVAVCLGLMQYIKDLQYIKDHMK